MYPSKKYGEKKLLNDRHYYATNDVMSHVIYVESNLDDSFITSDLIGSY